MAKTYSNYIVDQFMTQLTSGESSFQSLLDLNDPLFLDFMIIPHFGATHGLLADETHTNSALRFLRDVGEVNRYNELKEFIELFKAIMKDCMYIFQSISGISEAFQNMAAEPYVADKILSFKCWESVDWRMQALLTMYRSIAYDFTDRKVEILPRNLRHFQMSIYINDLRIFINDSDGVNHRDFGLTTDHLDIDIESTNHRMLHFGSCEFSHNAGTSHLGDLDSTTQQMTEIEFDLKYHNFHESSKFKTIFGDYSIKSSAKNIPIHANRGLDDSDAQDVKEKLGNKSGKFQSELSNAYDKANETFSTITGNTFEGSLIDVNEITQQIRNLPNTLEDELRGAIRREANSLITSHTLRNVFEDSDLDFFRNLDNFSINKITDNIF